MPRLTLHDYIKRHTFLRTVWQRRQVIFSVLDFRAQQELHAYYQPAEELSETELSEHKRAITKKEPSLPNRAGKHCHQLRAFYVVGASRWACQVLLRETVEPPGLLYARASGSRGVVVYPVARPETDLEQILNAVGITLTDRYDIQP